MTFTEALIGAVIALLFQEDPSLERKPQTMADWRRDVSALVPVHVSVGARGELVSPHIDALLLATVNYAESRFHLPAPGGDCYWTHPFMHVPSGQWPNGYEPKLKRVCPAIGPMQIAQGNVRVLPTWNEVQQLFVDRNWSESPLTRDELKDDIRLNVSAAYGILWHLKEECPNRSEYASAASWLTAYRWGRCTPQHYTKRYYDKEAKLRCERLETMRAFIEERGVEVEAPHNWGCAGGLSQRASDRRRARLDSP